MQPKILLPVVLGVWGLLGFKLVNGISPYKELVEVSNKPTAFIPKAVQKKDTFSIQLTERDPFLGTLKEQDKKLRSKAKARPMSNKQWPNIVYGGRIKKEKSSKQIFVLTVNNKQHLYKKGQTIDSLTLLSGNSKYIRVKWKGMIKQINI